MKNWTPADETRREAPAAGIQSMNMPTDYHALLEMIEAIVREIDIADVPPHTYYSIPEEDRYPEILPRTGLIRSFSFDDVRPFRKKHH